MFWSEIVDLLPRLLNGALTTLAITVISAPLALAAAIVAALGRLSSRSTLRIAALVYIELFRGTSLLVQLFFLFYVLPFWGIELSAWTTGVAALALNFGAYGAEIVRSALLAIPKGQIEAALVLHMRPATIMRRILLPQAVPVMLPPFGNLLIELLKATSLLSLITIADLAFSGNALAQTTGSFGTVYILLLLVYFVIAYALTLAMRALERRLGVPTTPRRPA